MKTGKEDNYIYLADANNTNREGLRTGFTTGSAAAAGAKAGMLAILAKRLPSAGGHEDDALKVYDRVCKSGTLKVDIPAPERGRLVIPVEKVDVRGFYARTVVIKDGGDDPDATHKAKIICDVRLDPSGVDREVTIKGGKGVGVVTRPGLPVPPGEPAINPGPLKQIRKAIFEAMDETGGRGSVIVTIHVPDGERIADHTMNRRLGIVGGISILGTRGTVLPFSNEAYESTITMGMDVAVAAGIDTVALSTGGKSERYLKNYENLPEQAYVQIADFFSFSLEEAVKRGFSRVIVACFFGKLVKMAQGHGYTHANNSRIDFDLLAHWCQELGLEDPGPVTKANTAREALEIIMANMEDPAPVFKGLVEMAMTVARQFTGNRVPLSYYLFGMDGSLLCSIKDPIV